MKSNVTSIFAKKEQKLTAKIEEDLTSILKVFKLAKTALSFFKYYVPAARVIASIDENVKLIEIKLNNEKIKKTQSKLEEP